MRNYGLPWFCVRNPLSVVMTVPVLVGFIVHRLELSEDTSDWSSSKKKRRRQDSTSQPHHVDSVNKDIGSAGFFFVSTAAKESLLVIPHALLKQVCDAARLRQPVKIINYSVLQLDPCSARGPQNERVSVLELHSDGLEIQIVDNTMDRPNAFCGDALSLTQFRALEMSFRKHTKHGIAISSEAFITATVDAISPIIAAVPSDPFALMELYEPGENPLSCVVVLKGPDALVCHAGIQPGDSITLTQVRRQKWHVPACFAKKGPARLGSRAPTYLFVVTDAASVCWKPSITAPPCPSTAVPLVSVEGLIVSVEKHSSGSQTVLHCVRLQRDGKGSFAPLCATDTLYVTHYPMSSELLVGARPGAMLRAVNVHKLDFVNPSVEGGQSNFGACLRSSITLLRCASERASGKEEMICDAQESNGASNLPNYDIDNRRDALSRTYIKGPVQMRPFAFGDVRQQHYRFELRQYLELCGIQRVFEMLHTKRSRQSQLPCLDEIEKVVLQHCTRQGPTKGRPSVEKNSLYVKDKHRRRDPYAEFFDHACEKERSLEDEDFSGCRLSRPGDKFVFPTFVKLGDIRNAGILQLKDRLAFALGTSSDGKKRKSGIKMGIQGGWTASFCMGTVLLRKTVFDHSTSLQRTMNMCEHDDEDGLPIVACCIVSTLDQESRPSSLADSTCQLAASFFSCSKPAYSLAPRCDISSLGDTVFVDIQSVIVSCLCLGTCATAKRSSSIAHVDLPVWQTDQSSVAQMGSCVLLEYQGMLFIASVQLRYGRVSVLGRSSRPVDTDACASSPPASSLVQSTKPKLFTIHECLRGDRSSSGHVGHSFVGLLVRQRFRFMKIRNGSFSGCVVTLSHIPETSFELHGRLSSSSLSSLQSIELKVSIPLSHDQLKILQKSIRKLLGDNGGSVLQEQSDLAAAWWQISDSGRASSLVASGMDDLIATTREFPNALSSPCSYGMHDEEDNGRFEDSGWAKLEFQSVPLVVVPCSAITNGGRGYLRFQCLLAEISSSFIDVLDDHGPCRSVASTESGLAFDAIGGRKFLPGALDRSPRRRQLYGQDRRIDTSRRCIGEMMRVPLDTDCGMYTSTLAHLHWNICEDMRTHTQTELAPSMVRVVRNANLLSIAYCRAQAECTRCFQPLIDTKIKEKGRPVSGIVSSVNVGKQETYWHLPLPMTGEEPSLGTNSGDALKLIHAADSENRPKTMLVCPNGCSAEHARIKWECSGVVDDGSGQAKLYAERDAALSLLGAGLHVRDIEAGAWQIQGGILFQKAVPPKSFVKQAILEAHSLAQQALVAGHKKTKREILKEQDVVEFLTLQARAEYFMQQHCRQSLEPARPLDYYVRCKPLSDEAFSLNQTQVEMATPPMRDYLQASSMDVSTYSLPPLKLTLVDCSVPQHTTNDSSWDLVRVLRST